MNFLSKLLNIYLEMPTLWTLVERVFEQQKAIPQAKAVRAPFANPLFDQPFSVMTDTASLAIFDNAVLEHRVNDEVDWLCEDDYHQIKEVKCGDIALLSVSNDGIYNIIVSKNPLDEATKQGAVASVTLGLKVISNQCFVGNAESLPGGEHITTLENIWSGRGGFFDLDNGLYDVSIYAFTTEDETVEDFIDLRIVLTPRTQDFVAPLEEPRFFY